MFLLSKLIGFGLRQVLDVPLDQVVAVVEQRFTDHSQTLPQALARANERAWQALGVALAGDGFLDQVKLLFASGDDKGVRAQVQLFLQSQAVSFAGTATVFRQTCLAELKRFRKSGVLAPEKISAREVAQQTATFQRHADAQGLVVAAHQAVTETANLLMEQYPNLARLLGAPTPAGAPLLAAAFAYFFRREVETDDELAHGLFFDGLRQLTAAQGKAFGEVNKALTTLGSQFDALFEQLDRIETAVLQTQTTTAATHGAVLDLQAELHRLEGLHLANAEEVRGLLLQVQQQLSQANMQRGEIRPHDSLTIRGDEERRAVRGLLARFRQLPSTAQEKAPALLNGLGKLQVGAGDFAEARETFSEVAKVVGDSVSKAEACFNGYRAALEERKWDEALTAICQAANLEPQRFAPFPLQRYRPQRLLGAGGFGTAFLCQDAFFRGREVVVKALHAADLERRLEDVFTEAHALSELNHPAIIGVLDCSYADLATLARPYIVMPYFPGVSLEQFVQQRGTLSPEQLIAIAWQVASGMREAHGRGILHRDLKPDNILVRKEGDRWQVKIIDFGLALRQQVIQTSMAQPAAEQTVLNRSVAGTALYAPPEQLGRLPGTKPGPYSDVYAFGKTCCFALFRTTEPKRRQWSGIQEQLADVLERCTEQELKDRLANFDPVLAVLEAVAAAPVQAIPVFPEATPRRAEEERRQRAAEETARRQAEEAELRRRAEIQERALAEQRQREQALLQQQESEAQLARLRNDTLERIQADVAECSRLISTGKSSSVYLKQVGKERLGVWKSHAQQGVAEAQWLYGDCLLEGVGVAKDVKAATKWFRQAADQGFSLAQMSLGNRYWRGEGVAEDAREALKWYQQAAHQGQPTAMSILQRLGQQVKTALAELEGCFGREKTTREFLEQTPDNMMDVWAHFAQEGMAEAQCLLGDCLLEGIGWDKDPKDAIRWFRKAAERGLAMAQLSLGVCYKRGEGVPKDTTEAVKWYRKAAAQGLPMAQALLKRLEQS